jgi:hypothetical protein
VATAQTDKPIIRTDFTRLYADRDVPDLQLNEQEFRLVLIRPEPLPKLRIDRLCESFEWRDEGAEDNSNISPILQGTLTLKKPPTDQKGAHLAIKDGYQVRCDVRWGGRWREVWQMRIQSRGEEPWANLSVTDRTWTFTLRDDLWLAMQGEATFHFSAKKDHEGWTYDQLVRKVCKEHGIPIVRLQKGKKRIKKFHKSRISPGLAIRQLTQQEIDDSGRRLVIKWGYDRRKNKAGLVITRPRRNPLLYLFRDQIRSVSISKRRRADFATAFMVTAKGEKKKDGEKKKVKHKTRVIHERAVKRFGYIERVHRLEGDIESVRELRRKAKRLLAKNLEQVRVIEDFQHAGIAFIRRGDAVRVKIPEEGYEGARLMYQGRLKKRVKELREEVGGGLTRRYTRSRFWKQGPEIAFVTSVSHQVSSGDYTMTMSLSVIDPLDPNKLRAELEKSERARKRRERKRAKQQAEEGA